MTTYNAMGRDGHGEKFFADFTAADDVEAVRLADGEVPDGVTLEWIGRGETVLWEVGEPDLSIVPSFCSDLPTLVEHLRGVLARLEEAQTAGASLDGPVSEQGEIWLLAPGGRGGRNPAVAQLATGGEDEDDDRPHFED